MVYNLIIRKQLKLRFQKSFTKKTTITNSNKIVEDNNFLINRLDKPRQDSELLAQKSKRTAESKTKI